MIVSVPLFAPVATTLSSPSFFSVTVNVYLSSAVIPRPSIVLLPANVTFPVASYLFINSIPLALSLKVAFNSFLDVSGFVITLTSTVTIYSVEEAVIPEINVCFSTIL